MSLQSEIEAKASTIFRDAYQMSIGELLNLYKDKELDIHPEFQRVFRWSDYQKTKLIESIMLNIPIPSIFVSQDDRGVWDVIDGVQRLSTIFQFVGIFRDEKGVLSEPLKLQKTEYLPSFEGMKWEDKEDENHSFTPEQRLFFKRSRIDIVIVKKESDPNTKYELFQRLNTGGTNLSDQEVRNCLMIMTNKEFYDFIMKLESYENYRNCVPISDRKTDEQYRVELVLRLLIAQAYDWKDINNYEELAQLLDKQTIRLCEESIDYKYIESKFKRTFDIIWDAVGENGFKRYKDGKHSGGFMTSAYQGITSGVFVNIEQIEAVPKRIEWLGEKIIEFYLSDKFQELTTPGTKAIPRYRELFKFGTEFFRP